MTDDQDYTLDSMPTMRAGGDANALARLGQYDVLRKLGGGGFGVVYLAKDTVSGVEVAIKTLHPLLKSNPEEMENLKAKFALVSRLHHPNIAAPLTLYLVPDASYFDEPTKQELRVFARDFVMVMSYAPGVPLSQWRKQFPDAIVPVDTAVEICRQIAAALDYAHSRKIVHRDIKPSNVMVETHSDTGELTAQVLDFGLAAEIRASMSRVSQERGSTSGTRPYMAPEQWTGRRQGAATDQYALACLFHELVSGAVPFAGVFETGDEMIMRSSVLQEKPQDIPFLSHRQNAALFRALAKDPGDRFPTCGAFTDALARKGTPRARKPWPWVAATILALGAIAFAVSPRKPVEPTPAATDQRPSGSTAQRPKEAAEQEAPKEVTATVPRSNGSTVQRPKEAGDRKVMRIGRVELALRWCPPGTFTMGSPKTEEGRYDNEIQHRVTLTRGFWLGETEVTQGLWKEVMGDNPSSFKSGDDYPVEEVSWYDCQEFVKKLNARYAQPGLKWSLPTEAQWEYACRAGTTTAYFWGNALNGDRANCDGNHPCGTTKKGVDKEKTTQVGSYAANEWGLYDMHGNVWEWCSDWDGNYPSSAVTDPPGSTSGSCRVGRGGSWDDFARYCRSAYRIRIIPEDRSYFLGLRVALVADQ